MALAASQGKSSLRPDPVIYSRTGLDVVVPNGSGHIAHVVHNPGRKVRGEGIYEIVVIDRGLSLKKIPVIQEKKERVLPSNIFLYIIIYMCERIVSRLRWR